MFWNSLFAALKVMTHWETYLVVLIYLLIMLTPVVLLLSMLKKRHALHIKYFKRLVLPVMESFAIALAVLTLFPIILHLGSGASWGFPFKIMKLSPGAFFGLLGILIVLAYLIDIIPKLRKLQSIKMLVLGVVCLMFVQVCLSVINPVIEIELLDFVPGFWFICGIILIAVVLSKLGHFVFISFVSALGKKFDLQEEVAELFILPVIAALGFLPVFIYGAWLS